MSYEDRIYATLQIDTNIMDDEQKAHLGKARDELSLAGISFDSGGECGSGILDWDLDWSLKGAWLTNPRKAQKPFDAIAV